LESVAGLEVCMSGVISERFESLIRNETRKVELLPMFMALSEAYQSPLCGR